MQKLQSKTLKDGQKPVTYEPIPEMLMSKEERDELLKALPPDLSKKVESRFWEKEYLDQNSWHR